MQLYLLYLQIIPTFVPIKSNPIINKTSTAVMKKKTILFASCLLGTLAFSSCEKNLYDESKQPEKEKRITDLNIPADFDWADSQNAKVKFTCQTATTIYVYSEKDCNENSLMLQMDVDATTKELPLEIPGYLENVYVKYEGESNVFTIPVENETISISTVPKTKALAGKAAAKSGMNIFQFCYPQSRGYATVMFEDMYPSLGDYDFNDFVAWYKLQIPEFYLDYKKGGYCTEYLYIGFQVRAIGGVYDYDPYIRLTDVKYDEINLNLTSDYQDERFKIRKGPNGEVILVFEKPSIPEGYKYFNTDPNQMTKPDLFAPYIYLHFKSSVRVERLQNSKVDIYLAKKNHGQEIHLKDYKSVYGSPQEKYANEKNFVWGFKIPAAIYHATETTSFLEAYPDFEAWVTSGGEQKKMWWENWNSKKLIIN